MVRMCSDDKWFYANIRDAVMLYLSCVKNKVNNLISVKSKLSSDSCLTHRNKFVLYTTEDC